LLFDVSDPESPDLVALAVHKSIDSRFSFPSESRGHRPDIALSTETEAFVLNL
jgi:hypothetical protein